MDSIQGGPKVSANGMHMLTYLIFEVKQKRGLETERKSRPNVGIFFKWPGLFPRIRGGVVIQEGVSGLTWDLHKQKS